MHAKSFPAGLTLFDPPGSSVHGILQARIFGWVPCPLPGDLPDPEIQPTSLTSPALAVGFFTLFVVVLLSHV